MFSLSKAPTEDASTKSLQSKQQKLPKLHFLDCRSWCDGYWGLYFISTHQYCVAERTGNIINNTSIFHTRISLCLLDLPWGFSGPSEQGSPNGRVISSVNPCVIVGVVEGCVWMGLQFKKASPELRTRAQSAWEQSNTCGHFDIEFLSCHCMKANPKHYF